MPDDDRQGDAALAARVRDAAQPVRGDPSDYDALLAMAKDARVVLIGEASHGTHDFHRERARITKRLVGELGFSAVAIEGDWPDAWRVNRYVRGRSDDAVAADALGNFVRFPRWMWRNRDVAEFVEWLRTFNVARPDPVEHVGFYGLDLYSLYASIEAVLRYLDRVDPAAAREARRRYGCLDHADANGQRYAMHVGYGLSESCEDAVVEQLVELERRAGELVAPEDGPDAAIAHFYAEQNARLVRNAEAYYRAMFSGRVSSWNLRDRHMAETLDALLAHLARYRPPKIVVWAHNSHVQDARATEMGDGGEWTLGQLARERVGREALLVGFTTDRGTVIAASDWDEPPQTKRVRDALLFHSTGVPRFVLPLRDAPIARDLAPRRLHRAIGVVYLPESERASHYFHASLPGQFDAVVHLDETSALAPLDASSQPAPEPVPAPYAS